MLTAAHIVVAAGRPGTLARPGRPSADRPAAAPTAAGSTAEQPAEEAATAGLLTGLLRLLRGLLSLLQLPLQPLDAVLRLDQRMLLDERQLGDAVARFRILGEGLADKGVSFAVDRRQSRLLGRRDGTRGRSRRAESRRRRGQ